MNTKSPSPSKALGFHGLLVVVVGFCSAIYTAAAKTHNHKAAMRLYRWTRTRKRQKKKSMDMQGAAGKKTK
jgi:hypothetical protein